MKVLYVGQDALERASEKQRKAHDRLLRRSRVRYVELLADGTLKVGYSCLLSRDRHAIIGANGQRLEARRTASFV